jgi:ribose transport system ATP-binding protein
MNDGSIIGNVSASEIDREKIIHMISNDYLVKRPGISLNDISKEVLRVENLTTKNALKNVGFSDRKGEIISITGSYGSGKCEIGYALFGIEKIIGGRLYLDGRKIKIRNPADAIKNKIVLISYENEESGLLFNLGVKENISILRLGSISHLNIIRRELEDWLVETVGADIGFDLLDADMDMNSLTPAQQRKVSIARAMSVFPKVLILIDPTKGLDNNSRKQILELLVSFSNRGVSIILISSNVHEILQVSNRCLLFSKHTITGVIDESELELKDQLDIFNNLI